MAAKHLCVVALCLLALVAPSFQAGTIFADNLTPVREDATFFGGISSTSATVSGAEVGTLKSGHREGFFIEIRTQQVRWFRVFMGGLTRRRKMTTAPRPHPLAATVRYLQPLPA